MDAWTWVAHYADGGTLEELDPHGDHGFADVDLERVCGFELRPIGAGLPAVYVMIDAAAGERPVFFRRRATSWLLAGGDPSTVFTCVGRRDGHGATCVFLDETGRVLLADEGAMD